MALERASAGRGHKVGVRVVDLGKPEEQDLGVVVVDQLCLDERRADDVQHEPDVGEQPVVCLERRVEDSQRSH